MEFGFVIPPRGPMATPENIAMLVQQGEAMGFSILGVTDHIIFPKSVQSMYPGSGSGQYYAEGESAGEYLEPLALLSFLAGIMSSAKLLTAVMVLPNRPPILTAKMLATIDVLSNGRVIVGCGVGWMREEFEALGAPPFEERGAVGNEYIHAFRGLWTHDTPTFEGKYCRFSKSRSLPSRYRSHTRPSGPAAKARRRSAERGTSPTDGITLGTTRASPWGPRSSSPSLPPESSAMRRKRAALPLSAAPDARR